MKRITVAEAWKVLFDKYSILEEIKLHGFYKITADQIVQVKEPRLMTKFDHSRRRPKIFRENKLAILPIDNGVYIIGEFNLYKSIPKDEDVKPKIMKIPDYLESIDPENIYSESNALNVALLSGMIEDMIGENLYETISGRMRATSFSFSVNNAQSKFKVNVERPQIEIDGGYEGKNKIIVIEAKNNEPEDFIIRQLYYPYRFWKMKVEKEIVPVFFTYKNGVYTFYIYRFQDDDIYNSIELVEKHTYSIEFTNKDKIVLDNIQIVEEDFTIPFPQADTFNRVKEIMDAINNGHNTTKDIAELYELADRQGHYYMVAAKYLGLVKKDKKYSLTKLGTKINDFDFKHKNIELTKLILSHGPFNKAFRYYLRYRDIPNSDLTIQYMSEYGIDTNYNNNVMNRRAQSVKGWIKWIINSNVEVV